MRYVGEMVALCQVKWVRSGGGMGALWWMDGRELVVGWVRSFG